LHAEPLKEPKRADQLALQAIFLRISCPAAAACRDDRPRGPGQRLAKRPDKDDHRNGEQRE
jgi:hypothetical protein